MSDARLVSVNVGLPRDVAWQGRVVRTAIWKTPVLGPVRVGRTNLEGDGQGDLAGHGGEQRAVFVYQLGSYRHWERELGRDDFVHGQFGENFTIEGLADDETCIGDRFRIGSAVFEVTQPRVTCYRVGIRLDEPRMPALLTSSGRPGFYFRVIEEGSVTAGDPIVKIAEGEERMTVTEVNALLYLPGHSRDRLERALRISALSPGWRRSFEAMLDGKPGLASAAAAKPGFASMRVTRIVPECEGVISLTLTGIDGALVPPRPGQFVVLRLRTTESGPPIFRSYSLSGPPSAPEWRISVKLEPHGVAGGYLQAHGRASDVVDVSAPRGSFVLDEGEGPVALMSAGIGATPVLAMLHALVAARSTREVWWLHGSRSSETHPFAREAQELVGRLARGRSHIVYSRPSDEDRANQRFDSIGHLGVETVESLGVPKEADFYLCGPPSFLDDLRAGLASFGASRVHLEIFGGGLSSTPGIAAAPREAPHVPADATVESAEGPLVSFARSGIVVRAPAKYRSLLELAEAASVPVRWSCRSGVCHSCESGLLSGAVGYEPVPLDAPAEGNVLICCSLPRGDVVIDL